MVVAVIDTLAAKVIGLLFVLALAGLSGYLVKALYGLAEEDRRDRDE